LKILIINGPNLNNLGRRDLGLYGTKSLADVEALIRDKATALETDVDFFQSNHEGAIVDYLQSVAQDADGIAINAGALTHYGLSMRDALIDSRLPIVEVHLSNIHARDKFRQRSVISDIAIGQIAGLSWHGYLFALEYLAKEIADRTAR